MTLRQIVSDPSYQALKQYVLSQTGLEYYANRDEDFAARLKRRLSAAPIADCRNYLAALEKPAGRPNEMDALVGELTIGETYFFREEEHFDLLRSTILPDLIGRNRETRRLRIWSAGCATGAEPYSIAILLQRHFPNLLRDWEVFIVGTDINLDFLEQARAGNFSKWALRDMPPEMQAACFVQNESRWVLRDEYRRLVEFRYHNLVLEPDPPFPDGLSFDLVVCRNVLIYFSQERIREAAGTFFRALAPAGWLLIGHAEHNTALFSEFEPVQFASTTAYRKEPSSVPAAVLPVAAPDIAFDLPPVLVEPARVAAIAEPAPSPAVLLGEARHLADGGKLADAAALCRRLIAQDPLNAGARLTLGLVLEHMGAVTEAAAELQKAIYADREIALAHYHLGTLRQSAGDLEAARKAFRNALEVLRPLAHDEPVAYGDGIRVSELSELARMHQETIGR